nr:13028_t:CDS:2 [Entrophospora candida]
MIVEEMGATLYNQWYHKYIKYLIRRLDTGTDNQKCAIDDIIIVDVNIQDPEYYDSANSINALLDANDVNEYFDNFDHNVSTEEALMNHLLTTEKCKPDDLHRKYLDLWNQKFKPTFMNIFKKITALSEVATSTQMNRKRCNIKPWDRN